MEQDNSSNKKLLDKKGDLLKKVHDENSIVDEKKDLLLEAYSEDKEILRALNIKIDFDTESENNKDAERLKHHDKLYNKESFTGKQIKELCNEYDLRILSIDKFKGEIPMELPKQIKAFADEHDIVITGNLFYVLAPVEMFKEGRINLETSNPIFFYQPYNSRYSYSDEIREDETLISVYDWGSDLSFMRKLRFLINNYSKNSDHTSNLLVTILFTVLFTFLFFLGANFLHIGGTTFFATILSVLYYNALGEKKYNKLWNQDEDLN